MTVDFSITQDQTTRVCGFGMTACADGYLARPTSAEQVAEVFQSAHKAGRQVVLRGAGRSYGDANICPEAVVLDCGRMDQVHSWDPVGGVISCGPGVTIEKLWRTVIEDGYWPHVVSGTMFPTLAGALAMNIHGKNAFKAGTLGEHVESIEVVTPRGERVKMTPDDPRFAVVVSGAGLHAAITQVTLKVKKVPSGLLRVLPVSIRDWDHHFSVFAEHEDTADYRVGWVDCLAKNGRGEYHAAWYTDGPPSSFRPENQDLPDTVMGLIPKSVMWRFLKPWNNRAGMSRINAAKYHARRLRGDQVMHSQSLVAFSFLLDYVPGWRNTYRPDGFIQYQCFVPRGAAPTVFPRLVEMQHAAGQIAFLGVLKRHRPDAFNFSHGVDGFSLAMDFKVRHSAWPVLLDLCHRMNQVVLESGGRFYLAKDSTLRPGDFAASVGRDAIDRHFELKATLDPDMVLTSALAQRLSLDPRFSKS